ncbi:endo alpha-1,4 polygalactosaminidase [Nocardia iowensis]|uniref:Endo alpha-1,4 polygalactosaminidase n=1 Tax=Nocardia iowensis TaxID=204891 RepID=A0ABX8RXT6_NOCIO|nr:endo alpha-1,4 polygalactosaminidase [Nocardia iowensis]QXN94479.1 endo alpha-1,4 polygalactosaminidase [Nocardia iowensis]
MSINHVRVSAATGLVVACVSVILLASAGSTSAAPPVALPTPHAEFDYQIGAPYTPPPGVSVISRDYTKEPVPGVYNICYVNAFQTQKGAQGQWDPDLLLRNENGDVIEDEEWGGEAILDLREDGKRKRIAAKVNGWIDICAAKGFQGVEPDNYDSYERSQGLFSTNEAQLFIQLLSAHAHDKGLAIAQKNTSDLLGAARKNGLDFAVAEECGQFGECDKYAAAFNDHVVVIEYSAKGLADACADFKDRLSIVRRDKMVTAPNSGEYIRETCRK